MEEEKEEEKIDEKDEKRVKSISAIIEKDNDARDEIEAMEDENESKALNPACKLTDNNASVHTNGKDNVDVNEDDESAEIKRWQMKLSQLPGFTSSPASTPAHSRSATPGDPFSESESEGGVIDGADNTTTNNNNNNSNAVEETTTTLQKPSKKSHRIDVPPLSRGPSWRTRLSASSNVSADSGCASGFVGGVSVNYLGGSPTSSGGAAADISILSTSPALSSDERENLLDEESVRENWLKKRRQRMSASPAHKIPKIMTSSIDSIDEREEDEHQEQQQQQQRQQQQQQGNQQQQQQLDRQHRQQQKIIEQQKSDLSRLRAVSLTNDRLLREIGGLKERIFQLEGEKLELSDRLLEIQEENDDMEFRLLEFENSRGSPLSSMISKRTTPQHVVDATLSDEGVAVRCNRLSTKYRQGQISDQELAMIEREKEIEQIEYRLEELGDRLRGIKRSSDYGLSEDDVETIEMSTQALTLASTRIHASNESIAALSTTIEELADVQNLLEAENVALRREKERAEQQHPPQEIVDELEETKKVLEQVREELKTTKDAVVEFRKMEAKWRLKFEAQQNAETRYKEQIANLKQKIESAELGSQYESQLWKEKLREVNQKEAKIKELSALVENLRFQLNEIAELESSSNKEENPDERTKSLEEQVVNLKHHIEECEAKEQNLLAEIEKLKRNENEEIESLKEQCQLLEDRQNKLKEENESLNSNIDDYASQLLKSQEAVVVLKHQLVVLDEQLKEEQRRPAAAEDGAATAAAAVNAACDCDAITAEK